MRIIVGSFSHDRLAILSRQRPVDVFMSIRTNSICYAYNIINLTPAEFKVLLLLSAIIGINVPTKSFIEFLYGDDENGGPEWASQCVAQCIKRLRAKFRHIPLITISTWWGIGYSLNIAAPQCVLEAA